MRLYLSLILAVVWLACAMPVLAGSNAVATIQDLRTALDTADEGLFDATVDMQSLVGQCVDILIEDAQNPETEATLPPILAMVLSTVGKSEQARSTVRATLIEEAGQLIRYGVRSGSYAGKARQAAPPSGMLAPLFADASLGRKEVINIGSPVAESDAVYVAFEIKDHGNGNMYPVEAWLRQQDKEWRVIGLRNVRALIRIIREEAARP